MGEPLGRLELEMWMGAVHATSAAQLAQLLGRRADTVGHWLAGSKRPAAGLREELRALSARLEVAAQAQLRGGVVEGRAGDAWQQAVASRALSIAASTGGQDVEVVLTPGVWSITTPDGTRREFTAETPALRTWLTEVLGHRPGRFRCLPPVDQLPPGATACLLVDGAEYALSHDH